MSVHNTCVYIRRQSLGSAIPVPIVPVQVESRQVYVSHGGRLAGQGRTGQGMCQSCGILNERGHAGSGLFLLGCGQGVAPVRGAGHDIAGDLEDEREDGTGGH